MRTQNADSMGDLLTEAEISAVNEILSREIGVKPEQLAPSATLDGDLGSDSLTRVEIIMAIEEKFLVTVPDELAEQVQTVEDVYDTLAKALGR
jgi:acyl carrier protein